MARFSSVMDRSRFVGTSQRSRYACACCCKAKGLSGTGAGALLPGLLRLVMDTILCRKEGITATASSARASIAAAIIPARVIFAVCFRPGAVAGCALRSLSAGDECLKAAALADAEDEYPEGATPDISPARTARRS